MQLHRVVLVALASFSWPFLIPPATARDPTFEERVNAQEAIDRIYYSHQIGATKSFAETLPRRALEAKVRQYLAQSAALESFWSTPVTGTMLQSEVERMARSSQLPARLVELFEALHNDPTLVLECLARPALVDRLTRNFFAYDDRIHGETQREAEKMRQRLIDGDLDAHATAPGRTVAEIEGSSHDQGALQEGEDRFTEDTGDVGEVVEEPGSFTFRVTLERGPHRLRLATYRIAKRTWDDWWSGARDRFSVAAVGAPVDPSFTLPRPGTMLNPEGALAQATSCLPENAWDQGGLGGSLAARSMHVAVWTGSVMIVWGGIDSLSGALNSGGRYDPATDTWLPTSTLNAPLIGQPVGTAWTGGLMIVWGGGSPEKQSSFGGRYDPVADVWSPMSTTGKPPWSADFTTVWTGSQMIIWGGSGLNTGGRYDPVADRWSLTSTINAPIGRSGHTAVWTGTRMIVWGGLQDAYQTRTGGIYDPATDSWEPTATVGAPSLRERHTAVWTGTQMVIWGGRSATFLPSDGGQYDPLTNSWTATSLLNVPQPRYSHTAVWTGGRMIVWGGVPAGGNQKLRDGAIYDPDAKAWQPIALASWLAARSWHSAIWTGDRMIVWGGEGQNHLNNNGGRYDPASDTWTPTSPAALPVQGFYQGVWTGNQMVVWGGPDPGQSGRYDPATASWNAVSTANAPAAREHFTMVWSGSQAIVWGGSQLASPNVYNTGGRYDPISDTWAMTATINAPAPRQDHTAIWTGSRMIIWGGFTPGVSYHNTGALYDPIADHWSPTSMTNVPSARSAHTAVWTGSRMIVWGGSGSGPIPEAGGLYDPASDSWAITSVTNAPSPRVWHTAVWTGAMMVVWGGSGGSVLNTGGRYDPVNDSWLATSTDGTPDPRAGHAAVWTGTRMIVWGGAGSGQLNFLNSGGRYDPTRDIWEPVSTSGAPSPRSSVTLLWIGDRMLVWGGLNPYTVGLSDGATYTFGTHADDDGDGYTACDGDCDDTNAAIHPGAAEICNAVNDNCDGLTDEDTDGDGIAACSDCAPADPGAFAPPPEIGGLSFGADFVTLRWDSAAPLSGIGIVYDVARGDLSQLPVGSGVSEACLESGVSGTSAFDASPATIGNGYWYLVRGRNVCATGSYGHQGDGVERRTPACP